MRTSIHVVVVEEAGPSIGLAFLAVFVAFPLGVAVALHGLNAPLSAINSFLQQGVDLLAQICASLLTLLFHIITFAIQVSLNLLKSIVTSSFRALACRIGELAGNFSNKYAGVFKPALNLIAQRITRFLKNSIISAASYMLRLLKCQLIKSIHSLSSLTRDGLVKLYEQIISTGNDINDNIASFINDSLESIDSIYSSISDGLVQLHEQIISRGKDINNNIASFINDCLSSSIRDGLVELYEPIISRGKDMNNNIAIINGSLESIDSFSFSITDGLVELYEQIIIRAKDIKDNIASFINDSLESIDSLSSSIRDGLLEGKDMNDNIASFINDLLESIDSLSSSIRDGLVELYEYIISRGKVMNNNIASFINDSLESISSRIPHALTGPAADLLRNSASSTAELAKYSFKALVHRIGKVLEGWRLKVEDAAKLVSMASSGVTFMRSVVPCVAVAMVAATFLVPASWYFELIRRVWDVVGAVLAVRQLMEQLRAFWSRS